MDIFEAHVISYTIALSPNLELPNTSLRDPLTTLDFGAETARIFRARVSRTSAYPRAISCRGPVPSMSRHHRALAAQLTEYIRWYDTQRIPTKPEGMPSVQCVLRLSRLRLLLG